MTDEKTNEKTEEQILFPEQTIAGIVVKPWTFGCLFSIAEPLERILNKIDENNLAEKLFMEKTGNITVDYLTIARVFTLASVELFFVMQKTLDVDAETLSKLSIPDGIRIALLMYSQNKEIIVNAIKNVTSPPQQKTELEKKVQEKLERGLKEKKKQE